MEGWKSNVTKARKFSELPAAAQKYVDWIEKRMECPITYVSVGPGRDELIKR
ncbi:Adenylosuccinate synthetase [bioreactor metagenome]|uniref:Adenylosuccinate synthetase n=1 Tax=bioreactor metagenome TaxID=1076179 RepID=A0A645H010_9ZZZZ